MTTGPASELGSQLATPAPVAFIGVKKLPILTNNEV